MNNFNNNPFEEKPNLQNSSAADNTGDFEQSPDIDFVTGEEAFVAQKIFIPETKKSESTPDRKGLKVFCLILVLTLVLSCFATGGYFLGKNSNKVLTGPQLNLNLESKPDSAEPSSASTVYENISKSVVGIYMYNADKSVYNASGIVYTEDGYIITIDSAYTTVPAAKFKVVTADGKEYDASFVAGDSRSNISVIKITDKVTLTPATLGNSDETVTGEKVYTVGFADGYSESAVLAEGIVSSAKSRVSNSITNYSSVMLQTTANANPGAFGGALANEFGQVVGMISTKIVTQGYENVTYAVPTTTVKYIAEALIADGAAPDRARIGISYVFKNSAEAELEGLKSSGLLIAEIATESELYSKAKANDIISKINGIQITSDNDVLDIIESLKPDDYVTLTVVSQEGNVTEHTVKLLTYEGTSSYYTLNNNDSSSNNGVFDFPEGY